MSTPRQQSRDFVWPVPPADLEEIEVLEGPFEMTGPPVWRPDHGDEQVASSGDQRDALDAPSGGAAGPASHGPESGPASGHSLPVWRVAVSAARRRLDSGDALPAWLGGGRVGWLAAGVLLGVVVAVFGVPGVSRDGLARPPTATILGVQLPAAAPGTPARTSPGGAAASMASTPSSPLPAERRPPVSLAAREREPVAATPRNAPRNVPSNVATRVTPAAVAASTRRAAPPRAEDVAGEAPEVLRKVQEYAAAWSRLDARATKAVFPSADRDALVQRFTAISEQRLTLGGCTATVTGAQALVTCRGTLRYRPRVGAHATRVEQARWRFALSNDSGSWMITSVDPS